MIDVNMSQAGVMTSSQSLPTRIAFCITDLDPGGAEWALFQIVTRLDRKKWAAHIYCLSTGGELVAKFEEQGIPVTCFGAKSSKDLRVFAWLTTELKKSAPQIVQGFLFHGNIASRISGYRASVPVRISGHRVAERGKRWHLLIDWLTKSFVQHHICVSKGVANFVEKRLRLKSNQVSVISNGVDLSQKVSHTNSIRQELGLSRKARIILAVGRLHPQKNFSSLIAAFTEISNQFDDTHLVIVGEGPQKNYLERLVAMFGLEGRVTLTGFRADVPELMSEAEVYVLCSLWEGMPNVILQAMQWELPIVTTDVEGAAELIQDRWSGRVVKSSSAKELGQVMAEVLHDQEAQRLYARNAKVVLDKEFTWDVIVAKYEQLYSRMIQR